MAWYRPVSRRARAGRDRGGGQPIHLLFRRRFGGVWRTNDGGVSWQPISDGSVISSIGAIAVFRLDPNVIYVGTASPACAQYFVRRWNVQTTDGGKTWTHIGLKDTRHIARLWIDPRNPDHVLLRPWAMHTGLMPSAVCSATNDGGKTWDKVLFKDDDTGAIDLAVDPHNSNVMFAALYQIRRSPWSMDSGGPGSGLYRSTDGGNTWKHLEGNGLPEGHSGPHWY